MLVVSPEPMYLEDNFLSMNRLMLIRDIFKDEQSIDQVYFKNESGFVLLAVAEGYLQQELSAEKMGRLRQYFGKNIKK
jgi:hypothetical protein